MIRDISNYYNHYPLASMFRNGAIMLGHGNDNGDHDDDEDLTIS